MIIESRDVVFFKRIFSYKREKKTSRKRTHETTFRDEGPNEPIVNVEAEPRRSQRLRISKNFGSDFIVYALESEPQIFKKPMSTLKAQM